MSKFNHFFNDYFLNIKNNFYVKKYQYKIYNLFGLKNYNVATIKDISSIKPLKIVDESDCYTNFISHTNISETVKLFKFKNCIINSRSSSVLVEKKLFLERINLNENLAEGNVIRHDSNSALLSLNKFKKIEEGFFLCGNGSYNWYHWLIEILPKILFFDKTLTNVILVDDSLKNFPTMLESLNKIFNLSNIDVVYLSSDITYEVKKLFFVSEINKVEFNSLNKNLILQPQSFFRPEVLKYYSQSLIKKTPNYKNDSLSGSKIYLVRRNSHRIANNEQEIRNYLQTQNFIEVDLTELTFDQQISVFYNSNIIVGTTGAAWSNLIFCQENTKVIIFSPDNFKQFHGFKEIASIFDIDMEYLYYNNNNEDHTSSNFEIDMEVLKAQLENI